MKYKILLVEDDKHFAYVLKSFLTTKGYDVDWYENGEIALEKYKIILLSSNACRYNDA